MHWIRGPAWDFAWILNALWLSPLVLFLAWGHDDARASPVDALFFALAVPLWFGHRIASAWLVYATPAYRPVLAAQRLRLVLAPLSIALACFAALLAPERLLPVPLPERVVWLGVLNYLLVSHHFAAQHFGVLSLYRARAGRSSDPIARRLDRWFALAVGGGLVVVAEALAGSIAFQDRWVDPWLGAAGADALAGTLRHGGILLVGILTALLVGAELFAPRPSLPRLAYVLGVAAMVLLALAARDPFLFIAVWSVQHWSAATGLASLAASGGTETVGRGRGLLTAVNSRRWAVVVVLAGVSALLLPILEVEAVTDEYAYADRIYGDTARWLRASPLVPALLALGLATGFVHYLLDRAAFRFSSPAVRRAARALLEPRGG
jgi:hypothetical protein